MSQENVEFVEALLSGTASLEKDELLAALPEIIRQTCHPDIEWVEHPDLLDRRVYRGHDGVRQSWERWLEQWDEYGFEVERFIDCGEDVLAIARENARGKTSGASSPAIRSSTTSRPPSKPSASRSRRCRSRT